MTNNLKRLIALARGHAMTPEEWERQRVGLAYGNVHYEDPRVTREDVVRAAEALRGR